MGWAGGSDIASNMIRAIKAHVPDRVVRRLLYEELYEALTDKDWDTVNEAMGLDEVFDMVAEENGWEREEE